MTDPVQIAAIGALTTIAVGVFNGLILLKLHGQSKANGRGINTVVEQTNGIHAKLVEAEKKLSHAEGMADQREKDQSK